MSRFLKTVDTDGDLLEFDFHKGVVYVEPRIISGSRRVRIEAKDVERLYKALGEHLGHSEPNPATDTSNNSLKALERRVEVIEKYLQTFNPKEMLEQIEKIRPWFS